VLVGYADGCTLACATNPSPADDPANGYHTELASIARQADGKRLFARFDQPDLVVTSVRTAQVNSRASLIATVANKGSSAASGAVVKFVEDNSTVGNSAPVNLEPGASTEVSIVWPTTRTRGTHVLTAIADPDNGIAESDESNNKTQASVYFK
jgi:subtilase family serine protease